MPVPVSEASLLHVPDKPFAYGMGPHMLRVVVRAPAGGMTGGEVRFNDRYAWEGGDYAPLVRAAPLSVYARDGELEYWAADLELRPPRLHYRFGLDTVDGRVWYGWDGLRDAPLPKGAFQFPYIAEGDLPDAPDWARGAVFYHIFPDRFARSAAGHRRGQVDAWDAPVGKRTFLGGDVDGIVDKLDHLESLSVDAVYLTPIFSSPSNHKYDTSDYFTVDPDFGGNAALRRLVAALHERGIRLVLDGVFNHAGSEWPPFVDVRQKGRASPYAGWFFLDSDEDAPVPGSLGYETWATNVATLPKLRTSDPELRDLICRIGRFWPQEFGVDGWRLDVASEVDHRLWRAFRQAVREVAPDAFLFGEIWHPALPWLRGDQLDSVMNYPFRRAILDFAAGAEPSAVAFLDAIDRTRAEYPEPIHDHLYNLVGSHDSERPLTACGGDRRAFALATALLFTLPGNVSIYYGDEVGMEGGDDAAARGGMVWNPERQDARLLDLHRRLGRLRRTTPSLRHGRYERLDETGGLVCFARGDGPERVVVLANAGASEERVSAARLAEWLGGRAGVIDVLGYDVPAAGGDGRDIAVPAQGVTLVRSGEARA
ncbi:MAG TPA: alpha amylase N-terminal ig-like domain-containing protein [Candidatus Caenarcaniphilales bacterium]|nr:alpha amylase N-terminal ig-like domain-containing protein [Candidatus Caenarcaniphilales bacterium]